MAGRFSFLAGLSNAGRFWFLAGLSMAGRFQFLAGLSMAGRSRLSVSVLGHFRVIVVQLGARCAAVMSGSGGSTTFFLSVWNKVSDALVKRRKFINMMHI